MPAWGQVSSLSEIASISLEFTYLARCGGAAELWGFWVAGQEFELLECVDGGALCICLLWSVHLQRFTGTVSSARPPPLRDAPPPLASPFLPPPPLPPLAGSRGWASLRRRRWMCTAGWGATSAPAAACSASFTAPSTERRRRRTAPRSRWVRCAGL